jgi:hypothetical protein
MHYIFECKASAHSKMSSDEAEWGEWGDGVVSGGFKSDDGTATPSSNDAEDDSDYTENVKINFQIQLHHYDYLEALKCSSVQ